MSNSHPLTTVCTPCSLGAYSRVYYSNCLPLGASTQCTCCSSDGIGSTVKAACYRQACRNTEIAGDRRCIMRSPGREVTGYANISPTQIGAHQHRPAKAHVIGIGSVTENHGEGFSRALSHELQHSWKPTRSRGRWSVRSAAKLGSRGGGRKSRALRRFHVPSLFRGPAQKSGVTPCKHC